MFTEQYASHVSILYSVPVKPFQANTDASIDTAGSGLLLNQEYIITTAQVIIDALKLKSPSELTVDKAVNVKWEYASISKTVKAFVKYLPPITYEGRRSSSHLLCLLQLESKHDLPRNIHNVTLSTLYFDLHNCFVKTLVLTKNDKENIIYNGYCIHEAGGEIRIDWTFCETDKYAQNLKKKPFIKKQCFINKPTEGSPVWDHSKNNIIGILKKVKSTQSYQLIPITDILNVCPNIHQSGLQLESINWHTNISQQELDKERALRTQADQLIHDLQVEFSQSLSMHIPLAKLHTVRQKIYSYHQSAKALQQDEFNENLWVEHLIKQSKISIQRGLLQQALSYIVQSHEIYQYKDKHSKPNFKNQRNLALSYHRLADIQQQLEKPSLALKNHEESSKILCKMIHDYKGSVDIRRDLSIAYNRIGDIEIQRKNISQAMKVYKKSLQLRLSLLSILQQTSSVMRDISVSYEKLGDAHLIQGSYLEAEKVYRKSVNIKSNLYRAALSNMDVKRDLSVAYEKLGNLFYKKNCADHAEEFYKKSLLLRQELIQKNPNHRQWQKDLSITYDKLAALYQLIGNLPLAEELCQKSLLLLHRLLESGVNHNSSKHALVFVYQRLGCIHYSQGENQKAESVFKHIFYLINDLLKEKPQNTDLHLYKIDTIKRLIKLKNDENNHLLIQLLKAYNQLGDQYKSLGKMGEARVNYQSSLKLYQHKISKAAPKNLDYQQDLVQIYWNLGIVSPNSHDKKDWLNKALNIAEHLSEHYQDQQIAWVETIKAQLLKLKEISHH